MRPRSPQLYTGWAAEAYPEMSEQEFDYHVERQRTQGANFLWIGHNNPGEVTPGKNEPGLSYAVYEAYEDKSDPRHPVAVEIVEAQRRLLRACQRQGFPVVLPVGYQIQMGARWNREHPQHLRRHAGGEVIDWGGISACCYSPVYREDIFRYYRWVQRYFIEPFRELMLMVNLADEPFGADYSYFAEQEFKKRYGMSFQKAWEAGEEGWQQVGTFQSGYIVEYARWSAEQWQQLEPQLPTTMSFCGYHAREENFLPSVPPLFSATPPTFQPTFDVYPKDGPPQESVRSQDITCLVLLLRQLAYLARRHCRPYWLWTTGNSWGLSQASTDKSHITDALANLLYSFSTAQEFQAPLHGIAIWNYNCKAQGLYNDVYETSYDPDEMFLRLSQGFGLLQQLGSQGRASVPRVAIVREDEYAFRELGRQRLSTHAHIYEYARLEPLIGSGENLLFVDCVEEVQHFYGRQQASPHLLVILGDGTQSQKRRRYLSNLCRQGCLLIVPEMLANSLPPHPGLRSYPPEKQKELGGQLQSGLSQLGIEVSAGSLFRFALGNGVRMTYNLSGTTQQVSPARDGEKSVEFQRDGSLRFSAPTQSIRLVHHGLSLSLAARAPLPKELEEWK